MSLYYNDGRLYDPPENPLKDKWNKLYPPISIPQYSQVCDGYSCMWCGRCPEGDNWEVPEEDREVFNAWQTEVTKYEEENGSILDVEFVLNGVKELLEDIK